jgi:hypothetical protein
VRKYKNYATEANPEGGCPRGGIRLSVNVQVKRDDKGKPRVDLRIWTKTEGMASVLERYGPDRSAWPYDAGAKKLRET